MEKFSGFKHHTYEGEQEHNRVTDQIEGTHSLIKPASLGDTQRKPRIFDRLPIDFADYLPQEQLVTAELIDGL